MNAAMKPDDTAKDARGEDAIALLTADHKKIKSLFDAFKMLKKETGVDDEKEALVKQICDALKIHAEIEEEIFYPAVRDAIGDEDLMDEALVEHAGAKELIAELEVMQPDEDLYDARVTVLGEQIAHHVKEEEGDMFVRAKAEKVNCAALGAKMAREKAELLAESADDRDLSLSLSSN